MPSTDPEAPALRLPAELRRRLVAAARAGRPEEVCGALLGHETGEGATVVDIVPLPNRAERPRDAYRVDPADLEPLFRTASVIGFYHSHPHGPADFSALDAAEALAGYWYVVIGDRAAAESADGGAELFAWRDEAPARLVVDGRSPCPR
ncbi:MAG: M67 family metallopeptidase [Gemmatimonadales bacterium]|jgi:proteasome lid subunit RPN8/RPN11